MSDTAQIETSGQPEISPEQQAPEEEAQSRFARRRSHIRGVVQGWKDSFRAIVQRNAITHDIPDLDNDQALLDSKEQELEDLIRSTEDALQEAPPAQQSNEENLHGEEKIEGEIVNATVLKFVNNVNNREDSYYPEDKQELLREFGPDTLSILVLDGLLDFNGYKSLGGNTNQLLLSISNTDSADLEAILEKSNPHAAEIVRILRDNPRLLNFLETSPEEQQPYFEKIDAHLSALRLDLLKSENEDIQMYTLNRLDQYIDPECVDLINNRLFEIIDTSNNYEVISRIADTIIDRARNGDSNLLPVITTQLIEKLAEGVRVRDVRTIEDLFSLRPEMIDEMSDSDQNFWRLFHQLGDSPNFLRSMVTMRDMLAARTDSEYFQDGKPTHEFIEYILENREGSELDCLTYLLSPEFLATVPPDQKAMFESIKNNQYHEVRSFIYTHRNMVDRYVKNGIPTDALLYDLISNSNLSFSYYTIPNVLSPQVLDSLPLSDREYWTYVKSRTLPEDDYVLKYVLKHRERFGEFVVNGKETIEFLRQDAAESPYWFIKKATKDRWKSVLGEDVFRDFLSVLPKVTDEQRNAFTRNQYDRTTQLIEMFIRDENLKADFRISPDEFKILTEYIRKFGLSRTPDVYRHFRNVYRFENGLTEVLADDTASEGLTSSDELEHRVQKIKSLTLSEVPMTDVSKLSPFETKMLDTAVGKSTHTFFADRPPIETVMQQFDYDTASGKIEGIKPEYVPIEMGVAQVELQFDPEPVRPHFEILRDELLESMRNPNDVIGISQEFVGMIQNKIAEIESKMDGAEGGKREFMQREITRFGGYIEMVTDVESLDDFVRTTIDMKFDKTEKPVIDSLLRRVIFRKIYQRENSDEMMNDLQSKVNGEISPAALLSIVNVIDHIAKDHVLNIQGNNEDGYWENGVFDSIKSSKNGRRLPSIFSPHVSAIRETIDTFEAHQIGRESISAIPDRGFMGEMAGYIANACYTKVNPLLAQYPDMTPYKFVKRVGDEKSLIGSVLVFEVPDADGNLSLLVRAMNIPDEKSVDIHEFTEKFLDSMTEVARKRGATRVLVPGTDGTISNYRMTSAHIKKSYVTGKSPVVLGERFAFNGYDITNNCYVARTVEQPQDVEGQTALDEVGRE